MPEPKLPFTFKPLFGVSNRRTGILAGVLIAAAVLVAYSNTFGVPLLLDDTPAIATNESLRHLTNLRQVLTPPDYTGPSGRPILNLSFAINYALGGANVGGYHAVNLLIHILAALTLFGIVRRTLSRLPERARPTTPNSTALLALGITLLWALHPLQTASITYISERAESLMGLFYLLTLYGLIRFAEGPGTARWGVLSVASCFLGMATKEVMVTAPLLVYIYDAIFFAGSVSGPLKVRWKYYLGLAASWLLLAWLMIAMARHSIGYGRTVGTWEYALTECRAIAIYLKLSFWPQPLIFDYGPLLAGYSSFAILGFVLIALLVGTTAALLRYSAAIAFLGIWFFFILAPTSSVVPIMLQPVAENRMYLPLIAVVAAFVLAARHYLGNHVHGLVLGIVVTFVALTHARNDDYMSARTIWQDTVNKRPRNPRAQDNLANALANTGHLNKAIEHYKVEIELTPNFGRAHYNLGKALYLHGERAAAIAEYKTALQLDPTFTDAQVNLASALAETGQAGDAQALVQDALKQNPGSSANHYELGMILFRSGQFEASVTEFQTALSADPMSIETMDALGTALVKAGKPEESVRYYEQALQIKPDSAAIHNNLGNALFVLGRSNEAKAHFDRSIEIDPNFGQAHTSLGVLFLDLNITDQAKAQFQLALKLNPSDAEAHFRLGNILGMAGQIPEAMDQWEASLRLRPDDAEAHNNLATALAQEGRTAEAIEHYQEALRLKPDYERARANLADLQAQAAIVASQRAQLDGTANPAQGDAGAAAAQTDANGNQAQTDGGGNQAQGDGNGNQAPPENAGDQQQQQQSDNGVR